MTEPVNLRITRKRRAREDAARTAAANRMAHGVSRLEALRANAGRAKSQRNLDQHKIENQITNHIETGERQ